jgi:phytoene dehydrogenase-like protein
MTKVDVVVVGAGFGGLGTALTLARGGARVVLCEALAYPGGCASTFKRGGHRYESGATLFSGFDEHQLFGRWIRDLELDVTFEPISPIVEHRTPERRLAITRDRSALQAQLEAIDGAPREAIRAFFELQRKVADTLWPLFDRPEEIVPRSFGGLVWHAKRLPEYTGLLPLLGKSLEEVLDRYGLASFAPLRTYLDALCQITVQCPAREAEALFALSAADYYYRGTGHVRGGIGALATQLVEAIRRYGGVVSLADSVREIEREPRGFRIATRRGDYTADAVVLNVLPQSVPSLATFGPAGSAKLDALGKRVEEGWGAVMLYGVTRPPDGASEHALHLDLVGDEAAPHTDGNHVFVSLGSSADEHAPSGLRTFTASSHIALAELRALTKEDRIARIERAQSKLRATFESLAPDWASGIQSSMTGSPRTFERFTQRPFGYVGGIPRRKGLHNYLDVGVFEIEPGAYLVGDSVFPGQSTLATTVGGVRVGEHLLDEYGARWARRRKSEARKAEERMVEERHLDAGALPAESRGAGARAPSGGASSVPR